MGVEGAVVDHSSDVVRGNLWKEPVALSIHNGDPGPEPRSIGLAAIIVTF